MPGCAQHQVRGRALPMSQLHCEARGGGLYYQKKEDGDRSHPDKNKTSQFHVAVPVNTSVFTHVPPTPSPWKAMPRWRPESGRQALPRSCLSSTCRESPSPSPLPTGFWHICPFLPLPSLLQETPLHLCLCCPRSSCSLVYVPLL